MRKTVVGSIVGFLTAAGLRAAMLPLRAHLSLATAPLVLVVPVVVAVVVGGLGAGVTSAVAGFLVYDFVFIPPYYTLNVGAAQNWVALGVYGVVVLLVARVVAHLESARTEAQMRAVETQRLYELSELFVKDRSLKDLLETVVSTVRTVFDVPGVALFLPVEDCKTEQARRRSLRLPRCRRGRMAAAPSSDPSDLSQAPR